MRSIISPLDGFSSPFGARRLGGGVSPFALYAANGFTPPLVADYKNEVYAVDGVASTFDDMHTYAGASLKTMVDSDGALKWAPHNLQADSKDISNWINSGDPLDTPTLSGNTDPKGVPTYLLAKGTSGAANFRYLKNNTTTIVGVNYTTEITVRYVAGSTPYLFLPWPNDTRLSFFNTTTGAFTRNAAGVTTSVNDLGGGYYRLKLVADAIAISSNNGVGLSGLNLGNYACAGDEIFEVSAGVQYRSDLGGMVNNPETGDSYVPTADAAVYLPRRGNHVWDGTEWVNEGVLIESAAATNLLLNSGTLATQSVTVTAVPHTLHFTGTGTVTLTGASTAGPLVGTGAGEENRTSLTFTPTAGSLTLTVSGTVTNADLIVGSTLQSHIPTEGATATRAAETLQIDAANMPAYTDAVSLATKGAITYADTNSAFNVNHFEWLAGETEKITGYVDTRFGSGQLTINQRSSAGSAFLKTGFNTYAPGVNVPLNTASRHGATFVNLAVGGTALTADTTPTTIADLSTAPFQMATAGNMNIGQVLAWPEDIGDTGIEEASAP